MTSARKKAAETMAKTDVVIEVVDARLPEASSNPMIHQLRLHRQRPCLKLLNKSDIADPAVTQAWLDYYNRQPGIKAVAISSKKAGEVARIPSLCQSLAPHRNSNLKALRMMIMGIPNVGKSTLMNALLKRKVAAVGDEPAVTKSQQTMTLNPQQSITDTPGMMWPKITHDSDGFMLAASHAIGVNAVIEEATAVHLAGILLERYPALLTARYGFDTSQLDAVGVIESIAKKRGCFLKGKHAARFANELDMDKASLILLLEYRTGTLGRISLETPQSRAAMLAAAETPPAADAEEESDE
jgi:ribosome biogenesis GTPase A